ncbi:hypothetical protein T484DRAFT_1905048, partial [Baffinella frigidus]
PASAPRPSSFSAASVRPSSAERARPWADPPAPSARPSAGPSSERARPSYASPAGGGRAHGTDRAHDPRDEFSRREGAEDGPASGGYSAGRGALPAREGE